MHLTRTQPKQSRTWPIPDSLPFQLDCTPDIAHHKLCRVDYFQYGVDLPWILIHASSNVSTTSSGNGPFSLDIYPKNQRFKPLSMEEKCVDIDSRFSEGSLELGDLTSTEDDAIVRLLHLAVMHEPTYGGLLQRQAVLVL